MAKGKKGSGKKRETAKRDLTGRKAGQPTKAELRMAARAASLPDLKQFILDKSNEITELRARQKSIGQDIQALREDLAAKGITKKGFDFAMRLISMDPEDRNDVIESLGLTMEANGLGKQEELDFGQPARSNDPADHCDRADAEGFRAAADGQFRTANPHPPETAEHDAWDAGWLRQTSQHAESMGKNAGATTH